MLSRRAFLIACAAVGVVPRLACAERVPYSTPYHVNISLVFGLFQFGMTGVLDQEVDAAAGTYRVQLAGEGAGVQNHFESAGFLRKGRFTPASTVINFVLRGRPHQTRITHDHERRLVHYDHRSETFFLGHVRSGRNSFAMPADAPVDDFGSVMLNFGAGVFETPGAIYRTLVVRRAHRPGEGVDEVQADGARGELVPLAMSFTRTGDGQGSVARIA